MNEKEIANAMKWLASRPELALISDGTGWDVVDHRLEYFSTADIANGWGPAILATGATPWEALITAYQLTGP